MIYRLIVLNGAMQGRRITVEQAPMVFGRDPDCQVVIPDEEVARRHAVLEHRPDGLFIRDLGSMNKVLINQREVRESRLKHGDVIELGRTRFLTQALVQADVIEESPGPRGKRRKKLLLACLLAAAVAAAYSLVFGFARPAVSQLETLSEVPTSPVEVPAPVSDEVGEEVKAVVFPSYIPDSLMPVSEEIRQMREDLALLREAMEGLAFRTTNPASSAAEGILTPLDDILEEARDRITVEDYVEADRLLADLQSIAPSFLPAYAERALLFELRGLPAQAIEQWSEVVSRGEGTLLHAKASAERLRLIEAARIRAASFLRRIRIDSVVQNKMPENDNVREMRLLKITLQPETQPLDSEAVRVEVEFFEEDLSTGLVMPAQAIVPAEPLYVDGSWESGEQKVVSATYLVPRESPEDDSDDDSCFHGYVVRVFYHDELQDAEARPKDLLDRTKADLPQVTLKADAGNPSADNADDP